MKITSDKNYSPLFCAKKLSKTSVLKKNILGKYTSSKVNLVRLDVYNESDRNMLEILNINWYKENQKTKNALPYYLFNICSNAEMKFSEGRPVNSDFYAITKQKVFLRYPNPQKVLGVAQMQTNNGNLEYIQVRPKYQYKETTKRKIKDIGKQFLKSLKELTDNKCIRLYSDDSARKFYLLQGGYPDENCRDILYI